MTWIVWGPKGCGKTHNRDAIVRHLKAAGVVDDWKIGNALGYGIVHLHTSDTAPKLPAWPYPKVIEFAAFEAFAGLPRKSWRTPPLPEKLPADWAVEQAMREGGVGHLATVAQVKEDHLHWRITIALARKIEQHEKPPLCPKLKIAREAAAQSSRSFKTAALYRAGELDTSLVVRAALKAIELRDAENA